MPLCFACVQVLHLTPSFAALEQVLIANEANSMACALSEYNRIRKPEADALAHMDSISSKWWSGEPSLLAAILANQCQVFASQ